jgi:hypothetical protein
MVSDNGASDMGRDCGFALEEGKRERRRGRKREARGATVAERRIFTHSRAMPVPPTIPAISTVPTLAGDRLYGISLRPQELAIYGDAVSFALRYGPVVDDPAAELNQHFKLLVLEIHADLKQDDALAHGKPRKLQLLKCGWELELNTVAACRTAALCEQDIEVPRLLERIADTVNELARRAGLEAPLGPELVTDLLQRYRLGLTTPANGLQ